MVTFPCHAWLPEGKLGILFDQQYADFNDEQVNYKWEMSGFKQEEWESLPAIMGIGI